MTSITSHRGGGEPKIPGGSAGLNPVRSPVVNLKIYAGEKSYGYERDSLGQPAQHLLGAPEDPGESAWPCLLVVGAHATDLRAQPAVPGLVREPRGRLL